MRIPFPIKAEIRGKAHSTYTRETVERRLSILGEQILNGDDSLKTSEEIAFLRGILEREFGVESPTPREASR